jgi:hypothetical protein
MPKHNDSPNGEPPYHAEYRSGVHTKRWYRRREYQFHSLAAAREFVSAELARNPQLEWQILDKRERLFPIENDL